MADLVSLHIGPLSWLKNHKRLQIEAKISAHGSLFGVLAKKGTNTVLLSFKETQWYWLAKLEITLKQFWAKVTCEIFISIFFWNKRQLTNVHAGHRVVFLMVRFIVFNHDDNVILFQGEWVWSPSWICLFCLKEEIYV